MQSRGVVMSEDDSPVPEQAQPAFDELAGLLLAGESLSL